MDGPVCSVFAEFKDHQVAQRLRQALALPYPEEIARANDPFAVLLYAAKFGDPVARRAEQILTDLEVEAMRTARPTKFAHELITELAKRGKKIVIVSNNSGIAVDSYLTAHGLRDQIVGICSRGVDPERAHHLSLLKPDDFALQRAMATAGFPPWACQFVGDTPTSDFKSAQKSGIAVVGFADKLGKAEAFAALKNPPDDIITCMSQFLVRVLQATPG